MTGPVSIPRAVPLLDALTESFWTSGRDGVLMILQCLDCAHRVHPPAPRCRQCHSSRLGPRPALGRGVVYAYTVNHQRWIETATEPYVVAIVELDDQPGLRLTTNVVDCEPEQMSVGMPVIVDFVPLDGTWIPVFRPV